MKYGFPNLDVCYAKRVLKYKNINMDESYSDLY